MEQRFWNKVIKRGDDECWEWIGSKCGGYGQFQGKLAHRVVWSLLCGEIGEGLVVRHKCRGKCVNPNHLELGTRAENQRDMIRDGTSMRGERNAKAKLTELQVREIKSRLVEYERGMVKMLAIEYGVTAGTISAIKTGRKWVA